ncbi:MAG: hypothetical protein KJ573_05520, partial [Proteobacteria bacterium]|nr:hypothetical protein [Pseudomonadota bacterium]MBU1903034.1 hypothetical protein [Pseudomonadota bacterium]
GRIRAKTWIPKGRGNYYFIIAAAAEGWHCNIATLTYLVPFKETMLGRKKRTDRVRCRGRF